MTKEPIQTRLAAYWPAFACLVVGLMAFGFYFYSQPHQRQLIIVGLGWWVIGAGWLTFHERARRSGA